MTGKRTVRTACPQCGDVASRVVYDIGDGPELSCASCEWCWGADGQMLHPMTYNRMVEQMGYDPMVEMRRRQLAGDT